MYHAPDLVFKARPLPLCGSAFAFMVHCLSELWGWFPRRLDVVVDNLFLSVEAKKLMCIIRLVGPAFFVCM